MLVFHTRPTDRKTTGSSRYTGAHNHFFQCVCKMHAANTKFIMMIFLNFFFFFPTNFHQLVEHEAVGNQTPGLVFVVLTSSWL